MSKPWIQKIAERLDDLQPVNGSYVQAIAELLDSLSMTGTTNTFTTGGTYNSITEELVFDRNDGNTYSVDVSQLLDDTNSFTTGGTYNSITESIDFNGNTLSTTFSVDVSQLLDDTNTYVTGGTYSTGTLTLNRNDGNLVTVTGFTDNTDNYTTGGTYNSVTEELDFVGTNGATTFSVDVSQLLDDTNTFTTGATLNGTTLEFNRNDISNAYNVNLSSLQLTGTTLGSFGITIDGGGSPITTGEKGSIVIPYNGTITGWVITSDVTGSTVIDLWKDTYDNYPTTSGDTITGTEKPTLSSQIKNRDLTLTSWTTNVTAGDVITFNVDSASTVTRVNLTILITKQ